MSDPWYTLKPERWYNVNSKGWHVWQDTQRQRLYRAERHFRRGRPESDSLKTLSDLHRYAHEILNSDWVTKKFGKQEPVVIERIEGRTCWAFKYNRTVAIAPWGFNKVVMLHELAHIIHPGGAGVSHGRFFARLFLELIGWQFGKEARKILMGYYKLCKVCCRPRPQYSVETLKRLKERGRQRAASGDLRNQPKSHPE